MESPIPTLPPLPVADLLKRYDLRPTKGLGQNFLVDDAALRKIVRAAGLQPQDEVLEVGPGLGSLTRYLAAAARRVVAVELDKGMLGPLGETLGPYDNVEIVQGDILETDLAELFSKPGYLVVANIPYYITSALLRHVLEAKHKPARLALTVQKEVAERMGATAGSHSLLSLSVQVYGQPRVATTIKAGSFYPIPKVDSAVVVIDLYAEPVIPVPRLDLFFRLIKAGFSQKRKTLRNTLSAGMGWDKGYTEGVLVAAGVDAQRRAQTLSLAEWGDLALATENG